MKINSTSTYSVFEVQVQFEGRNYTRKEFKGQVEWRNKDVNVEMPLPLYEELEENYNNTIHNPKN